MRLDEYLEVTHTDVEEFREQVRNEAEKKIKTPSHRRGDRPQRKA